MALLVMYVQWDFSAQMEPATHFHALLGLMETNSSLTQKIPVVSVHQECFVAAPILQILLESVNLDISVLRAQKHPQNMFAKQVSKGS